MRGAEFQRAEFPRTAVILAGIDCGTNSVRLLVAASAADGTLREVHREMRIVRLGQDVDRTGRLAPAALERTRAALADYARVIESNGAERVRLVATSATRDASNRDAFVTMVRGELGVTPEIATGAEEAALTFAGAASVLGCDVRPLLVADIGGGSTELVRGGQGRLRSHSMDIGAVRMTERHLHADPPTPAQLTAARAEIDAAIRRAMADIGSLPATLVGVAGTVTTVAALALGLRRYDAKALHGATITATQIASVTSQLSGTTLAQRSELSVIHPGRRDVIVGGALILDALLRIVGATELIVSEHDILDGIVAALVPV